MKVLLVIAHPDDETVFFSPLLASCHKRGDSVDILCLSNGNVEGLGNVRDSELKLACKLFGISENQITVIDHPELADGMKTNWPITIVADIVCRQILNNQYSQIYTFDEYGVSGHVNHIATYQGVQLGLMQLRGNYPTQSHSITCYKLNSKNIFRKFLGILDIFITCVWDDSTTSAVTEYNLNPFLPLNALQLHYNVMRRVGFEVLNEDFQKLKKTYHMF